MKVKRFLLLTLLVLSGYRGICQETVFALLQNDLKLADNYFEQKNFQNALSLYIHVARKSPSDEIDLKIARSYHFLKQYDQAVAVYEGIKKRKDLPLTDIYYYAEGQLAVLNYEKAIESYRDYLTRVPDDQRIIKKIWRLDNIEFLYEDSTHYAVRPVPFNTKFGELCAVPYRQGLVFMSNRKEVQVVNKEDAALHAPFYQIYYSSVVSDSAHSSNYISNTPTIFNKEWSSSSHAGPLAFYDHDRKMVFTCTRSQGGKVKTRTLELCFAEMRKDRWKIMQAFPYNSADYSVSDPAISRDGKTLYFSSDMKGGLGGKDLYKSEYINGHWAKPENLGDMINTAGDEVFPYLHFETLYFSSNGHAGLGGLDIFKSEISSKGFDEPQNAGYPINTNFDEFGISIDSMNTHGYFSSNRKKGAYDDDLYEFDMDLQSYPLQISGLIKYKEHGWADSVNLKALPKARLYLIDIFRNTIVYDGMSDDKGNFAISIPYFSKYKIKVVDEGHEEYIVSLDIPKHRQQYDQHEIVIVKETFKSSENIRVK